MEFDVICVGGGVVGSLFTALLGRRRPDLKIALLENKQLNASKKLESCDIDHFYALDKARRMSAINTGLLEEIQRQLAPQKTDFFDNACPMQAMQVFAQEGGSHFRLESPSKHQALAYTLSNDYLSALLKSYLCASTKIIDNVTIQAINRFDAQNSPKFKLNTTCGELTTQLLVGGDGINSYVRNCLHIEKKISTKPATAIGGIVYLKIDSPQLKASHDQAFQWFMRDGSVIGFLPDRQKDHFSFVWSLPSDYLNGSSEQQTHYQAFFNKEKGAENLSQFLFELIGVDYGIHALKVLSKPVSWPLNRFQAKSFIDTSAVLIGDAAHSLHPLAGQGLNLGLEDCFTLVELLGQSDFRPINLQAKLAAYNWQRQAASQRMSIICENLRSAFENKTWLAVLPRNIMFDVFDHSRFLQSIVSQQMSYKIPIHN